MARVVMGESPDVSSQVWGSAVGWDGGEDLQFLGGEVEVGGLRGVGDARRSGRAGDGQHGGGQRQLPGQADLLRADAAVAGDLLERLAAVTEPGGAADATERAPRQERDPQLRAQFQLVCTGAE